MHIRLIALTAAVVMVSGCDRLPAPPVQSVSATAPTWPNLDHRLPTTYRHATDLNEGETERLAAHPELAVRSGLTLKIFHNGKLIRTLKGTDCDKDPENCDAFTFIGAVALMSPVTHRMEPYAQVAEGFYEGAARYFIPLESGKSVDTDHEASGSPDGHWLASGSDGIDDQGETLGNLMIRDMAAKHPDIIFDPSCMPNQWTGPNQFTALCERTTITGDLWFEAQAALDAKGQWTLTTTRILAYQPFGKTNTPVDPHQVYVGTPFTPSPQSPQTGGSD
ncbi:hypothetical protein [Asticcacaulis solisilvae]|uniref:hypothetical protein n=1 Tax=Asticcacaulis solisilvae TaxID=1217274 RepID=UPI003FD89930